MAEVAAEQDGDLAVGEPVPLQERWCFWVDKPVSGNATAEQYEESLHNLCTVQTVQDFWGAFNTLPLVGKMRAKSSLHMMKFGIRPLWEDPMNVDGGFWAMRVKKDDTQTIWADLCMAASGEQFDCILEAGDSINGITVSVRQHDNIIEVWNRLSDNKDSILKRIEELIPQFFQVKSKKNAPKVYYKKCRQHTAFSEDHASIRKKTLQRPRQPVNRNRPR